MLKFLKKLKLFNKKKVSLFSGEDQEDFSIELFQLENLINNQVSFLFFNLSSHISSESNYASSLLQSSQSADEEIVRQRVKELDKSKPIVLICERGEQSRNLTKSLQKEGFINVFFVTGGIISLTKADR